MSLRLIIEDDEGATTIVPLGSEPVTIGRLEGNTIRLTEQNVSRRHAMLHPGGEGWQIEDLGSYNGVRVNEQPVQGRTPLQRGDIAQIGDYYLTLSDDVDRDVPSAVRPTRAANDARQPLLASSSAQLPRLTPEQLETVDEPSARAVAIEAPGPVRSAASAGLGLLLGGGVGLAVLLAGFFLLGRDRDPAAPEAAAAAPAPSGESPAAVAPSPGAPPPVPGAAAARPAPGRPVAAPTAAPRPTETVDRTPASKRDRSRKRDDGPSDRPATPAAPESDPRSVSPPAPEPAPEPRSARGKEPAGDPDALLTEARNASLTGNPGQAYSLAQQSNQIRPSRAALEVMGVAACKMGDADKARAAYRKLPPDKQTSLAKLCGGNGISLP